MKEVEIEVFRTGTKASRGITAAMLADVAAHDCSANPVPVVIGHPKSDSPAAGEIKGFRLDGNSLFAKLANVKDHVVEAIRKGDFLNRSMAFFSPDHEANPQPGKLAPRHLGLLGGSAPGIPGMPRLSLAFDADGEETIVAAFEPGEAIIFTSATSDDGGTSIRFQAEEISVNPTPEQIAEAERLRTEREQLDADRAAFAASQKTAIETANGALVDGLISKGLVAPANAAPLKLVFNALASDDLTFAADRVRSPAVELATFLESNLKPIAPVDGSRISPSDRFSAKDETADPQAQARTIEAKAQEKMKADPGLTFEAAVEAVYSEQEA